MNCVRTRGEEPPRLYGVINGLLRMRNGLRRSQELDDLVDVLAMSVYDFLLDPDSLTM